MTTRRTRWSFFMALAMGSAACGTLLGDVPDGRLEPDPDGGSPPSLTPDGSAAESGDGAPSGPPGWICVLRNGVVLDLAVDDDSIYWLRRGQDHAVEACPKGGGNVRTLATLPASATPPEAIALSDKYVFWSIGDDVWRGDKKNGLEDTAPWKSPGQAGPLASANGYLIAGTHAGHIYIYSVNTGTQTAHLTGQGNVRNMAIDGATDTIYYSMRGSNDIRVSRGSGSGNPTTFATTTAPFFLTFDQNALYWAATATGGTIVEFQCLNGCARRTLASAPGDFTSLAVQSGGVYWTVNEQDTAKLRGCSNRNNPTATCPDGTSHDPPLWTGKANVSRIALDASDIYLAATFGADTYIIKRPR
ncbi:hypothetical protein [Pendulispora albinea]|uniref:DUF5050 domain-containing protein n=1 Tax=Pendulispora albinea TaxID=2741071 RepID=A0ABZ2LZK0_9BACT